MDKENVIKLCNKYSNNITKLANESMGIDIGLKDMAICSNIEKPFKNINKTKKVKKLEKKLCRLQHKVSNKYEKNKEGSSYVKTGNIVKLEKSIRKVHKKLDNIRTDYRHKVTIEIVKTKPSKIVMESLNICEMMKTKLSLSEREFKCECCGAVIDRDKNASINLSRYKVS